MADIHFYFDPVCPFCWMTSKWVRTVQAQRGYSVDWRFISLRILNASVDYDAEFPPEYEAGHTAGLRLLRVAARARAEHGRVHGGVIVYGRVQGEKAHALAGQGQRLAVGIAVDRVRIDRGQERHLHPAVDQLAVRLVGNDVDRVAVPGLFFAQERC